MARRSRSSAPVVAASSTDVPPGTGRASLWAVAVLVVTAAGTFAGSLGGPFVYDDDEAIVRNPFIRALTPIGSALNAPPHSAVSGRPLISLSLAVNHALGGLDPIGYHVWNVAVHVGVGVLLFGVVRRTFRAPVVPVTLRRGADGTALACALLWLLHPLNSEVVENAILRTESMMGASYLLALYAAIRGFAAGRGAWRWLAVSVVAGVAGAACKESMVTAPPMVLLYDAVFAAGAVGAALRRRPGYYAALTLTWVALAVLNGGGPRSGAGFASEVSAWTYLQHQGPMIATYLKLAVWPAPLVADYGSTSATAPAGAWPWLAGLTALAGLVAAAWRTHRPLAYLGTWFFVTLAPASSVVPIATEVGAERRMYLPLMALVVLGALGARTLIARLVPPPQQRHVARAATAMAVAALMVTTIARHDDYRDRLTLWQSVVDRRPHGRAHHNLGIELAARQRPAEALEQYRLATPDEPKAHYALAYALAMAGRPADAAAEARQLLTRLPGDALAPNAASLLGVVLAEQGDHAGAIGAFTHALTMRPTYRDARAGLADSLRATGRWREAAEAYRTYLEQAPNDAVAFGNLGVVLSQDGQTIDATRAFARAVELTPESAPARFNYGLSLLDAGRRDEALAQFRRGLALDPRDARLHEAVAGLTSAAPPR